MAWENDRIAHRMYGLALNSPPRAANGCAAAASMSGRSASRIRSSIAGMRRATTSSTRTRKAKASTSTASAARAAPAAPASGMAAKLWTSDNFTNARCSSNGPRRAAFKLTYAPWDAGAAGQVSETKHFTRRLRPQLRPVESTVRLSRAASRGRHRHHRASAGRRVSRGRAHAGSRGPLDELLGREQGRRPRHRGDSRERRDVHAGFAHEDAPGGKGNANNLLLVKAKDGVPRALLHGRGLDRERAVRGPRGLGNLRARNSRRARRTR